jgi:hypothetical protein
MKMPGKLLFGGRSMNSKHGQTRERDQERRQEFFEQEDQEARGKKKER